MPVGILAHPIPEWWLSRSRISMRYVMMDTNIFIDMIIDHRYNVSEKLVKSFMKLLDFDEI